MNSCYAIQFPEISTFFYYMVNYNISRARDWNNKSDLSDGNDYIESKTKGPSPSWAFTRARGFLKIPNSFQKEYTVWSKICAQFEWTAPALVLKGFVTVRCYSRGNVPITDPPLINPWSGSWLEKNPDPNPIWEKSPLIFLFYVQNFEEKSILSVIIAFL